MTSVQQRTLHNRVAAVISHISWYGFKTQARLAEDSQISRAAISRLIRGQCNPSLTLALLVTQAIEKRLAQPLDLRELFSLDGSYPTPSVCTLVGCHNCLPTEYFDAEDNVKPEFKDIKAGQWSVVSQQMDHRENPPETQPKGVQ